MLQLEDEIYIKRIRKHLWSGREFGRAAVMVGAGFSRNADRARATARPLPLWSDLARAMYAAVHSTSESAVSNTQGIDALRIAGEYEHLFKRASLDDLLIQATPDLEYAPGRLHKMLLSLPWSDVYTTNYDTLLERTRIHISDRKYDVVNTAADIASGMKPRIVKLHGSFPSHRPFIITAEDYRTYPRDFASFVNTVQQSIMENIFCLIGFSGDDPNFIAWTGWVRDNLGSAAPPIYFCGLLGLSSRERTVLEKRGVIPIDLAPMFTHAQWPDPAVRHARALEWLLLSFANGQTVDAHNWPNIPDGMLGGAIWAPSLGLPDPVHNESPATTSVRVVNDSPSPSELVAEFTSRREMYPNWLVCPTRNRKHLQLTSPYQLRSLAAMAATMAPIDKLRALYEINWIYERLLDPLPSALAKTIAATLETINPYPLQLNLPSAETNGNDASSKSINWQMIGNQWVSLAFAIVREARRAGETEVFQMWIARIKPLTIDDQQRAARCSHEICLWHFMALEFEQARKCIDEWPETPELPFWEVRRAALMAEFDQNREASKLADRALDRIRSQLRPYLIDYEVMSEEGLAMLLSNIMTLRALGRPDFATNSAQMKRWAQLDAYDCNPWTEIERLTAELHRVPASSQRITKDFDPGTYTYSSTHGETDTQKEAAYRFLVFAEVGAVSVSNFSSTSEASVIRIARENPLWAFSTMVRAGLTDAFDTAFDRATVLTMAQSNVNALFTRCSSCLPDLLINPERVDSSVRWHTPWHQRVGSACVEMLSRLTFRLDASQREKTLGIAINLYKSPFVQTTMTLHKPLERLFSRLLLALSDEELTSFTVDILGLPLLPWDDGDTRTHTWSDPFQFVLWPAGYDLGAYSERKSWSPHIESLLEVAGGDLFHARENALIRLEALRDRNGLTADETQRFVNSLWSYINPQNGLPAPSPFLNSYVLKLPGAERYDAARKFRSWATGAELAVLTVEEPRQLGEVDTSPSISWSIDNIEVKNHLMSIQCATLLPWSPVDEAWRIDWTQAEAVGFLGKLDRWIAHEVFMLRRSGVPIIDRQRSRMNDAVDLLADVILPRLAATGTAHEAGVVRVLEGFMELGVDTTTALPGLLVLDPTRYDAAASAIRRKLVSNKHDDVWRASSALFMWHAFAAKALIPAPPPDLLDEMIGQIVARRQPGMRSAIRQVTGMLDALPAAIERRHLERLFLALEYLLADTRFIGRDSSTSSEIPAVKDEERGDYRAMGATLAGRIVKHLKGTNAATVPILEEWRKVAETDPLPEVRRAWRGGDDD